MRTEVLLSTMHQKDFSVLEKIGLKSDAVVVNQCDEDNKHIFTFNGYNVVWINTSERGLSRSRNMALSNSKADICLLTDDDEVLDSNYVETLNASFEKYPDASVASFRVEGIEAPFKIYTNSDRYVGFISSMKISSVEIAIKRKDIVDNKIRFDELIGAGTKYLMGEENAFLFSCLKSKLRIVYISRKIADLHLSSSTWFTGYNREYMHAKGAAFTAMSKRWSRILALQFVIRKRKLYSSEMTVSQAYKSMCDGRKEFLALPKEKAQRC